MTTDNILEDVRFKYSYFDRMYLEFNDKVCCYIEQVDDNLNENTEIDFIISFPDRSPGLYLNRETFEEFINQHKGVNVLRSIDENMSISYSFISLFKPVPKVLEF